MFDFLDPLRQLVGPAASFPFGAPPMDAPSGPTAPPSASWGPPPVPGTPQGAENRSSMMVAGPGAPTAAAPLPPPSPLRAGAPPPGREKGGEGPPIATPQQAAAARVTPGTPAAVSGPTGAVDASGKPITTPAADPALRAPYANPGSPVPGAAPGAPPATAPTTAPAGPQAPGDSMGDKLKALGQNKDFMGALGKMAGAGGGGGGGGGLDLATGSPGGDPAAQSRQGSADLLKSIVEGGRPGAVPAIPEFDPKKFLFAGM